MGRGLIDTGDPMRQPKSGQALVEFALVIPIFLLCFFGLVDGARAVYTWNALSQAAREGARLASVEGSWIGGGKNGQPCTIPLPDLTPQPSSACPVSPQDFQDRVTSAANRETVGMGQLGTLPGSSVVVKCSTNGGCSSSTISGDSVTVTVRYPFTMLTPIIGQIVPSITMGASATMVID